MSAFLVQVKAGYVLCVSKMNTPIKSTRVNTYIIQKFLLLYTSIQLVLHFLYWHSLFYSFRNFSLSSFFNFLK